MNPQIICLCNASLVLLTSHKHLNMCWYPNAELMGYRIQKRGELWGSSNQQPRMYEKLLGGVQKFQKAAKYMI